MANFIASNGTDPGVDLVTTNKIGIGITNPVKTLDVANDFQLSYGSSSSTVLEQNPLYLKVSTSAGEIQYIPTQLTSMSIQACLDAASIWGTSGYVFLPAGKYIITSTLTIYPTTKLVGAGQHRTILLDHIVDTYLGTAVIQSLPATWTQNGQDGVWNINSNICIRDLSIQSDASTQVSYSSYHTGVFLRGVGGSILENISVDGMYSTTQTNDYHSNLTDRYFNRGIHVQGWANTLINCGVTNAIQGYNLSFEDYLPDSFYGHPGNGNSGIDATNATSMYGCYFAGGDVPMDQVGCYISGTGNSIFGGTFEKGFNSSGDVSMNPPRDTIAIHIHGVNWRGNSYMRSSSTTISGVYIEAITTTVKLDDCQNTNIYGLQTMSLDGYPSIVYMDNSPTGNNNGGFNNADPAYCNNVQNIHQSVWDYDYSDHYWHYTSEEIIGTPILAGTLTAMQGLRVPAGHSIWIGNSEDSGSRLRLHHNGANAYIDCGSDFGNSNLYFRGGDLSTNLTIDTSGNLGIGKVPTTRLDVAGNVRISDNDIYLRSDTNHGLGWYGSTKQWNGVSVDGPVLYGYAGGVLGTAGGNSTLYWNSSSVGIGTTSPGAKLHIVNSSSANVIRLKSSSGNAADICVYAGNPNGNLTALKGSICLDTTNGRAWSNNTGGTVWTGM